MTERMLFAHLTLSLITKVKFSNNGKNIYREVAKYAKDVKN